MCRRPRSPRTMRRARAPTDLPAYRRPEDFHVRMLACHNRSQIPIRSTRRGSSLHAGDCVVRVLAWFAIAAAFSNVPLCFEYGVIPIARNE
jgi:hypothetical protein